MKVLKNIAWLVGLGVLAGVGALVAMTFALMVISKMAPLKVEGYEITPVKQVDVCAEVASGAVVPLSENVCKAVRLPLFDDEPTIDVKMAQNALNAVTVQSKVIDRGLKVVDSEPTQESLQQASVYELHRGASSVNYQGSYNEVK